MSDEEDEDGSACAEADESGVVLQGGAEQAAKETDEQTADVKGADEAVPKQAQQAQQSPSRSTEQEQQQLALHSEGRIEVESKHGEQDQTSVGGYNDESMLSAASQQQQLPQSESSEEQGVQVRCDAEMATVAQPQPQSRGRSSSRRGLAWGGRGDPRVLRVRLLGLSEAI